MSVSQQTVESLVCHCYELTEAQIRDSINALDLQTVEDIVQCTSAGSGCTACHYRIQRMLAGLPATCNASDTCATCGLTAAHCACRVA